MKQQTKQDIAQSKTPERLLELEDNEAKALGDRWDNDVRKWYVPDEMDRNLFTKWLTEGEADQADPFFG